MKESALGVSITMIHIVPKVTNAYMWPSLSNRVGISFLLYVLVSHKWQFAHVIFIIHSLVVLIQVVSGDQDLKGLQFYAKEDIMWTAPCMCSCKALKLVSKVNLRVYGPAS